MNARSPAQVLDGIIAVLLFIFVLSLPHSIAASEIAYGMAALAWVVRLAVVRRGPEARKLYSSPLDLPILIYWVLCAISASMSPRPALSWIGMRKVGLIFLVLVVAHNVLSGRRAKQLVVVSVLAILPNLAYTAWQYTVGVGLRVYAPTGPLYAAGIRNKDVLLRVDGRTLRDPNEFIAHLNRKPPDEPLRLRIAHAEGEAVEVHLSASALPRPTSLATLGMRVERAHPFRAGSIIRNHVTYAVVLQMTTALAFGLWLAHPTALAGASFGALCLASSVALWLTLTRAPWLAALGACFLALWFHARRFWVRALLPVALVFAVVGTDFAMRAWRDVGLLELQEGSTDYRRLMWQDGFRLMREHPWFGVGMNMIRDHWQEFDLAAYKKWGYRDHFLSTPIQLGVDLGLPALAAWIVLMAVYWFLLVGIVRRARAHADRTVYGLSLGILAAASGFLATSVVHYNFGDSKVVLLFWFLMGSTLVLRRELPGESASSPRGQTERPESS